MNRLYVNVLALAIAFTYKNIALKAHNTTLKKAQIINNIIGQKRKLTRAKKNLDYITKKIQKELFNAIDLLDIVKFKTVIDLKDDLQILEKERLKPGGIWVVAAEKKQLFTTNFSQLLWNANTIICPSPRAKSFHNSMRCAVDWIEDGTLDVDSFWTRGYDRNTEWQQAFTDGVERPEGYSRGYLIWP